MDNLWICDEGVLSRCSEPPEEMAQLKTMNDPLVVGLGYRKQAVKGNVQLGPFIEIFQLGQDAAGRRQDLPAFVVVVNGSFSVMATILVNDFDSLLSLLNQKLVFLS